MVTVANAKNIKQTSSSKSSHVSRRAQEETQKGTNRQVPSTQSCGLITATFEEGSNGGLRFRNPGENRKGLGNELE